MKLKGALFQWKRNWFNMKIKGDLAGLKIKSEPPKNLVTDKKDNSKVEKKSSVKMPEKFENPSKVFSRETIYRMHKLKYAFV
jgi:hypothetical protein